MSAGKLSYQILFSTNTRNMFTGRKEPILVKLVVGNFIKVYELTKTILGKIFRYSQQAIDHEYKDRGLAPYVCKHCPFKSADNWALAKHKKVCPGAPAVQNVMPALNLTL